MAITCVPATAVSKTTMVRIDVTSAPNNVAGTSTEVRYRLRARLAPNPDLISEQFSTNAAGTHTWFGPIFPAAGTWVVTLRDAADTQIQTANITVT